MFDIVSTRYFSPQQLQFWKTKVKITKCLGRLTGHMSTLLSDKVYEGKKIALPLGMLAVFLWKMSLANTCLGSLSNAEIQDK